MRPSEQHIVEQGEETSEKVGWSAFFNSTQQGKETSQKEGLNAFCDCTGGRRPKVQGFERALITERLRAH